MRDWEKVRSEHGPMVWSTVFRIIKNHNDALDCYQEVLVEGYQKDRDGAITNLPGLLRWLAIRRALDFVRSRLHRGLPFESVDATEIAIDSGPAPGESFELAELMERVRLELSRIPSMQAQAFWLCCVEQFSYAEAAQQMSIDKQHVGVLVFRAREQLRQLMSDLKTTHVSR